MAVLGTGVAFYFEFAVAKASTDADEICDAFTAEAATNGISKKRFSYRHIGVVIDIEGSQRRTIWKWRAVKKGNTVLPIIFYPRLKFSL